MNHPSKIYSIELDVIHNSKAFSFGELKVKDVSSKELMHRIQVGSDGTWSTPDITHKILSWAIKPRNTDIFKVKFECAAIKTRCLQKQHPPGIRINYKTKSRVKRGNSKCRGDGRCCLRNITATAEEMGWSNWMISPKDINLFFCAGTCNNNAKLSYHGKLMELTSGKKPELCCIPTQIEYVHYFHVKDNFTAFHKPIKMNVTECGCG